MPDPTPQPAVTTQPGSDGSQRDTQSGAESVVKEALTWWEERLQKLPPEDRESIIGKIKGYDKEFSRKMQQLSRREQEIAEVAENLKSAAQRQQPSLASVKAQGDRIIDQMMADNGDPATRETLRQLREIIRQETKVEDLEKKIATLEGYFQNAQQRTQLTRQQQIEKELPELRTKFGDALVEKYTDAIFQYSSQNDFSARKLLHALADPDEVEQALEIQSRRKQTEPGKKQTQPASPLTSTQPQHPSERYKGKTPNQIHAGRRLAVTEAVAQALKGRLGFGQ